MRVSLADRLSTKGAGVAYQEPVHRLCRKTEERGFLPLIIRFHGTQSFYLDKFEV